MGMGIGWRPAAGKHIIILLLGHHLCHRHSRPCAVRNSTLLHTFLPFHSSSSSSTSNSRGGTRRFPPPCFTRSSLFPEGIPHLNHLAYLRSLCFCFRFLSLSSQRPELDPVSGEKKELAFDSHRADKLSGAPVPVVKPDELEGIVEIVEADGKDMELRLNRLNPGLTLAMVKDVVRVLNDLGVPSLRFLNWVISSTSSPRLDSESYNLVVDNLGRVEDFDSMSQLLKELSDHGLCLTEKAFTFVTTDRNSGRENDLIRRVMEILNRIGGGSCRGSGIHSLIRLLCSCSNYELALSVIKETAINTSYCNKIIAAKCREGDWQGATDMLVEMKRLDCKATTSSYNYLLGNLFKNRKFAEGCDLLQAMEELGFHPDPVTFELVVFHACKFNRMDLATEFINKMLLDGLKPRLTTHAALIKSYFQSGRVTDARKYVIDMSDRDRCSTNMNYSLLASLFWVSKRLVEAGEILNEMMEKGLRPNFPVYMKILNDLHKLGRRDLALELKSNFSKFPSPSYTR